jgi:tRNA G18 (ribose-2'-O)-methylase SpoU
VAPIGLPVEEIRQDLQRLRRPLSIAVLRAKNPFNIGAIIRVAHSFLVREIILVGDAPWYERAAMGMDKYENILELPDEAGLIAHARGQSLPIIALERDDRAAVSLWQANLPGECLMVFGNEDTGVSPELLAAADQIVAIPMYGINHSFPVSVAAGIAMAEWTRRYVAHAA